MTTQMTSRALHQAIVERYLQPGVIPHADRGVLYASHEYSEQLQAMEAQSRRSAVGNPYDNAKAESFFNTVKQEEGSLKEENSCADAEHNLTTFIENVSHEKRLPSSLGSVPPAAFEAAYLPVTGR
jgi:transposase InsO family protein